MDVLFVIRKELDINLNSFMTGELSKAIVTDNIPTSTIDVLLAVIAHIKARYLNYEERYGIFLIMLMSILLKIYSIEPQIKN